MLKNGPFVLTYKTNSTMHICAIELLNVDLVFTRKKRSVCVCV